MQDNNDTAKQRKSKITYTRQESKSAGSHKQPGMRKAGVQLSYKATTRKENKNTKYFGFHVYWWCIVPSVLICGFSCISTFMSEMPKRWWLWNEDDNDDLWDQDNDKMMMTRWWWDDNDMKEVLVWSFPLLDGLPTKAESSIYSCVGFV